MATNRRLAVFDVHEALTNTGRTDMVWTFGRIVDELSKEEVKLVWPKRFENGLLDAAISGVTWLSHYGVEGPWLVMATLVDIKDYHLVESKEHWSDPAWRGQVTLPPLVVELMNRAALLPLLRSFWLAFGLERPANPFADPR